MVPGFKPKEWDRDKILDWVIGDEPLTDQQLEFLIYFGQLKNRVQELEAEVKEANNNAEWWRNRFYAVSKNNDTNYKRLQTALYIINCWLTPTRQDTSFHNNLAYIAELWDLKRLMEGDFDEKIYKTSNDDIET